MIVSDAARGSTIDEIRYTNNTFTYMVTGNVSQEQIKPHLEGFKEEFATFFYPVCIKTIKNYLQKRESQVNRRETPNITLFKKASGSGGSYLSCLATRFYPRHINLTLLRDGQPVSDHELTGGDLLPNEDGTYQMRKSLEIRVEEREKHKYTCSVEHLGRNYTLDIILEFDPGEPFKSVIPLVLMIICLVLVFGAGFIIYKCCKRQAASSDCDYSASSTSE
ncbi:major histocompatibility complex class I-related gene protein-like [Danio aesculapii]|uniref:major histocompatibility complex class I-related gene protein-like n=1 Tax=Danio aesculapii TaxID=1142201 RepID=UPI0024BF96F3|nr:major histocompatibility complex class I-related gene protein-like [Danio aesculapii]